MIFKDKWMKEEGFTLIEVMMALSISTLCFLLLSAGVNQIKIIQNEIKEDKQIEWHLFINQLEYYLQNSKLSECKTDELIVEELIEEEYHPVRYLKTQNFFIRRYNAGTQPLLTNIDTVSFEQIENSIKVTGSFYNGEKYHARIWVNSWNE